MNKKSVQFFFFLATLATFTQCVGAGADGGPQGGATGADAPRPSEAEGATCKTGNPDYLCLALKYVVYNNEENKPVVSQEEASSTVANINKTWNKCNLGFQIEEFAPIEPAKFSLKGRPADTDELYDIRKSHENDKTLLVVTTTKWDRSGSLGNTGANAWTSMPGEGPYGAVLEDTVGKFGNIIAHELGHYLDLPHVNDTSDLMNPIIYDKSTELSSDQCRVARSAATSYWQKMLRT